MNYQAHLEGNQMMVSEINTHHKDMLNVWGRPYINPDWLEFERTKQSYFTNDPLIKDKMVISGEELEVYKQFNSKNGWVDIDNELSAVIEAAGIVKNGLYYRNCVRLKPVSQPVNEGEGEKDMFRCRVCKDHKVYCFDELCEDCEDKQILKEAQILIQKPVLTEAFADNGEHSHWRLIDPNTGDLLWTEDPKEDAILYTGFQPQTEEKPEERKPCPFCGKSAYECCTGDSKYTIKCIPCGVSITQDRKDKVRSYWNNRVEQEKSEEREQSNECYMHDFVPNMGMDNDYTDYTCRICGVKESQLVQHPHPIKQEDKPDSEAVWAELDLIASLCARNGDAKLSYYLKSKGYSITKTK